jgi:hypothetical protein
MKKIELQKILPVLAVVASIISLFTVFAPLGKYFEYIIALAASLAGSLIAYFMFSVLIKKRDGNVFILYSNRDKEFVKKLSTYLNANRFIVYYDDKVLNIGDNVKDTIYSSI